MVICCYSLCKQDNIIYKRNFLAICTGLRYNKPTAKDIKTIFFEQSIDVLIETLMKLVKFFKEFSEGKYIEVDKILRFKNFSEEKMQKSLNIVFSEPVDLTRFISCLPFFKWIKTN